jgi:hypothetical protein
VQAVNDSKRSSVQQKSDPAGIHSFQHGCPEKIKMKMKIIAMHHIDDE